MDFYWISFGISLKFKLNSNWIFNGFPLVFHSNLNWIFNRFSWVFHRNFYCFFNKKINCFYWNFYWIFLWISDGYPLLFPTRFPINPHRCFIEFSIGNFNWIFNGLHKYFIGIPTKIHWNFNIISIGFSLSWHWNFYWILIGFPMDFHFISN